MATRYLCKTYENKEWSVCSIVTSLGEMGHILVGIKEETRH